LIILNAIELAPPSKPQKSAVDYEEWPLSMLLLTTKLRGFNLLPQLHSKPKPR